MLPRSGAAEPWHDGRVEIAAHIDSLERDGVLLADAAEQAGLTAPVPACPGWQVRDLVRHQAYVHSWAARHVREQLPELIGEADEAAILGGGPPDSELVGAYRAGHAALVAVLRDADPDVKCAAFLPAPSPLAFWARRQAHETAIHRFDAQAAAPGGAPGPADAFEPAFADDGIDELIMGFAARRRYRLRGETARSLAIRATDTGGRWGVRLADGATEVRRGAGPADCVLDGPAAGLYAFAWNRCDSAAAGVTVNGDPAVLETWGRSARVRW
jgi:uncharacterized protein (TIGR03083 family)